MIYPNTSFRWLPVAAAFVLGGASAAGAAEECSNADFYGRYATQSANTLVGGPTGNWAAGSLYADGEGLITEWSDTFVLSVPDQQGGERKVVQDRDVVGTAAGPVVYEVTPDCRITIKLTSLSRPPNDQAVEIRGGLANGGKEVLAVVVLPQPAKAGMIIRAFESESTGPLARLEALLARVAARLSIRP